MIITLNKSLNKVVNGWTPIDSFLNRNSDSKYDYETKTYNQSLFHYQNNLPQKDAIYHNNYLEYLQKAWADHYGVVIKPDIIWYILLTEIASIIKENPETYRHLFTNSNDKKTITLICGDPTIIPLDQLMAVLKQVVPTNTETFLPTFSTSNDKSTNAFYAAFADAVSPFYDYCTLLCGIPFIDVQGTKEDWLQLQTSWNQIKDLLNEHEYFERVNNILTNIIESNDDFWKNMFYVKRCGSGHQEEIYGWITDLFRKPVKSQRFVHNFPTQVSIVNYKDLTHEKDFQMIQGLFSSSPQDEFLVPEFGYVVYEKRETEYFDYIKPNKRISSEDVAKRLTESMSDEINREIDLEIESEYITPTKTRLIKNWKFQ